MTKRKKPELHIGINAPVRGGYPILTEGGKEAKLVRATSILDWLFKGAMSPMSYWGGKLAIEYMLEHADLDEDQVEGVYELWKMEDRYDPNKVKRTAAARGTQAHALYEDLCHGVAWLDAGFIVRYNVEAWAALHGRPEKDCPLDFEPESYDLGAARMYDDLFRHLDRDEYVNEERLYWTEHPIDECPDEICTHGFAGTTDVIILPNVMGDVKTHKPWPYDSDYWQMALYGKAWKQRTGHDITAQFILIPTAEGDYVYVNDMFMPIAAADILWDLFKMRREWGPKDTRPKTVKEEVDDAEAA